MALYFLLLGASCLATFAGASSESTPPPISNSARSAGGLDYASLCERVKCDVLEKSNEEIDSMRKTIIEDGGCVPTFGVRCDTLCNKALEDFALNAPDSTDLPASSASIYDRKVLELETALDAPLQVLYLRQLAIIREKSLQQYRTATRTTEVSDYEAMLSADSTFSREAEEATRADGSETWDYSSERSYLQSIMNDMSLNSKKLIDVQIKSAQQHSTAMQFLQNQQQMIQQLQAQLYGQTSPWNVGVAYRIPDTNLNLSGTYQQGRTNVQLSCVPDEYAPMLGPNGFSNGVGPGNLGLSFNLSV